MDGRALLGQKLYRYAQFIVNHDCITMTLEIDDTTRAVEILFSTITESWVCLDKKRESIGLVLNSNLRGLDIDDYEPNTDSMYSFTNTKSISQLLLYPM
jgi:hypothetical protein